MSFMNALSNGLSAMGSSIATTAGNAAINAQKAQIERESQALADQLARGRITMQADIDTKRDATKHGYEMETNEQQHGFKIEEIGAQGAETRKNAAYADSLDAGDIKYLQQDETGNTYGVRKDGSKVDVGIKGANTRDDKLLQSAMTFGTVKQVVTDDMGNKTTQEVIDPKKTAEYLTGRGRKDLASAFAPNSDGAPAKPPAGSGTNTDPYKGTSQADVDWFKSKAQPGQVIIINGTKYTK